MLDGYVEDRCQPEAGDAERRPERAWYRRQHATDRVWALDGSSFWRLGIQKRDDSVVLTFPRPRGMGLS